MSELEPPPEALKDLFAAEKTRPAVDVATRAAVRARVAAAVGGAPLGAVAAGGGIAKALATVALVVAAGAGTFAIVKHVTSGSPPVAAAVPHADVQVEEAAAPAPVMVTAPVTAPPVVETGKPRISTETELLSSAWQALSSGDAEQARSLVASDARLHPHGALAEERDAVDVLALAQLHRTFEARVAAARFVAHYPTSVHRARIETTVQEMP